jgi:branched-subunit amino acid transport protein
MGPAMSDGYALTAIAGLALVTLLTRAFFLIPERDLPLPGWLRRGLRYAPLAALLGIVVPEIVMDHGHLLQTWRDPQLFAAAAGLGWYAWRRRILGTIVAGTLVMLALRLGLGW